MRSRPYILFLLLSAIGLGHLTAQETLTDKVAEKFEQYVGVKSVNLLSSAGAVSQFHADGLGYAEAYKISHAEMQGLQEGPQVAIALSVDYRNKSYELQLVPHHFTTAAYDLRTSDLNWKHRTKSRYYHGTIVGEKGWATLAVMDEGIRLLIAHASGNIEIVKKDGSYIGYESSDRKSPLSYTCGHPDVEREVKAMTGGSSRQAADCIELYIECDYQSYLDNGSSASQTESWSMSILNDVITVYGLTGVPFAVSDIFVHTSTDPYTSLTDKAAVRNEFVAQVEDSYDGRVAYLLSTRDLEGGIAYGIGGFCSDYPSFPGPYAVATTLSSTTVPYPSYSFNVQVVAHELGHVLGARHTHACVWNGNNTQIDDCGNVWAEQNDFTPEGTTCFDNETPVIPTSGTIMSYCDLVAGVGIDLSNGFGTQVASFLQDQYTTALCSTGGLCATVPPSNDDCGQAISIPNRTHCVFETYDHVIGTSSSPGTVSCATLSNYSDVWFSFVAGAGTPRVQVDPEGTVGQTVVVIYTGSCGGLTEINCGQSASGGAILLPVSGLSAGETVYVRVIGNNGHTGAFDICVSDPTAPCHPFEDALVDLYVSTNGSSWTNNSGWGSTLTSANCDICQWYGITCDNSGNIIEIDLSFNNLTGTVPTSLGSINTLRKLNLFSNNLTGTMPDIWDGMLGLEYLDLSANTFTGLIPRTIIGLPVLQTLYLENNLLQDTLPKELGDLPSIDVFWVKNNQLTGCFPSSYASICSISSKSFTGNAGLPGGGDFDAFCADGTGADADFDNYCRGDGAGEDCDDEDYTIYPGAPEICDGKDNNCNNITDEGSILTNTWLGGNDSWHTAARWSLGAVPRACEDVIVLSGAVAIGAGQEAYARSVTLTGVSSLTVSDTLWVSGSDDYGVSIGSGSTLTNVVYIQIENVSDIGLSVDGTFDNSGVVFVENKSDEAEVVVGLGAINNSGGDIIVSGEN